MGNALLHIQMTALNYFHMPDLELYTLVNTLVLAWQFLCSDVNILHFALII